MLPKHSKYIFFSFFFNECCTVVFKDVNVVLFCGGLSLEIIFKLVLQRYQAMRVLKPFE